MTNYIPQINMNMISEGIVPAATNYSGSASLSPEEQVQSLFLKNMMKEIIRNETKSFLGEDENIRSSFMPEILVDQLISQIIKSDSFGLNKIFEQK